MSWLRDHRDTILAQVIGRVLAAMIGAVLLYGVSLLAPGLRHLLAVSVPAFWLVAALVVGFVVIPALRALRKSNLGGRGTANDRESLSVFRTRAEFESVYPFKNWMARAESGCVVRFIGVTLFHLMNKPDDLMSAIERGATIELCLLDPDMPPEFLVDKMDLDPGDIEIAIRQFARKIAPWLKERKREGAVELRGHRTTLFDSFVSSRFRLGAPFAFLDLSFGRDVSDKRLIVVDPDRGLGQDLSKRYETIWKNAQSNIFFKYAGGAVVIDRITERDARYLSAAGDSS